jgi:hypothetical protein
LVSIQSGLHRHEAGWRRDKAIEGRGEKGEDAGTAGRTADEYEYRCAEYEYEYDGKRSAAMIGFYFVLSPLCGRYSYSYSLLFRFLDDDPRRNHDG